MNDSQHERYSRQMLLPWVGLRGQEKLLRSRVLIVGVGGLGSPVALYLAAAGVGTLVLCDFDNVDLSNLQRQVIHGTSDVGRPKVESAADAIRAINPDVQVIALNRFLQEGDLLAQVEAANLVIDASDNFETRFAINHACLTARRPLVSGAAIRTEGQVTVFRNDRDDAPCYRCLYREAQGEGDTCSLVGVLGPLVGLVGTIQASEAIKLLTGEERGLSGRLLLIDALTMECRAIGLRKDPGCPACGGLSTPDEDEPRFVG